MFIYQSSGQFNIAVLAWTLNNFIRTSFFMILKTIIKEYGNVISGSIQLWKSMGLVGQNLGPLIHKASLKAGFQ